MSPLRAASACLLALSAALAAAQATPASPAPTPDKYPLRLHVLAVDDVHPTRRLQPNWCAGNAPEGDTGSAPCSASGSTSLGGGLDDFEGTGRGDLVSPPSGIGGLNFSYSGCTRIRVAPGFHALPARWSKPGSRLEVVLNDDESAVGSLKTQRCTLKVVPQQFVYLRLGNRSIVRVSPEAYAKKPALRAFLSGGPETLQRRKPMVASNKPD